MDPGCFSRHITEEDLESYSMNRLPDARLAEVEEHLLICPDCQDRLEETDRYIRAVRSAAVRFRREEAPLRPRSWRGAWVLAAASAMLATAVVATRAPRGLPAPAPVSLEAVRGPMAAHTAAPAGQPLALRLDARDLAAHPAYRVEVVDEGGRRLWDGAARIGSGHLAVLVPKGFSPGRDYVRVYSPAGELLREYGIDITPR